MAHFDLIALTVQDMSAALRFYRLLGLDIPANFDAEPHVEVPLPGGLRLAWDTLDLIKSIYPDWVAASGQRTTLAFNCATPAEVDALHAQLVGAGYHSHKSPWDAFWGQRYAVITDPDGNLVDLFAAL